MIKSLPKLKKSVSSFLVEEDAKLISKAASKVVFSTAIATSFILINAETGNALNINPLDDSDSWNHQNSVFLPSANEGLINLENSQKSVNLIVDYTYENPQTRTITVPEKTISAVHSNHYDHSNSDGW